MEIEDKLSEIVKHREDRKILSSQMYKNQSKIRLQKIIEKKINTTMIGAISIIEAKLGNLWGQGKVNRELTDLEIKFLAIKEELRTEILNNGNNQKRAALAEIEQYDVVWKRHHIEVHITEK